MTLFWAITTMILVGAAFAWVNYANYKHAKKVGYEEGYHEGFHKGRLEGEGYRKIAEVTLANGGRRTTWVKEGENEADS